MKRFLAAAIAVIMGFALVPSAMLAKTPEKKSGAEISSVDRSYLNILGCLLTYSEVNSSFPCTTGTDGDRKYIQINNGGHASTTAGFRSNEFTMVQGETLCFDYWYETEETYDLFRFTAHKVGGSDIVDQESSGTGGGWWFHTFTCPESGNYYFTWEYTKDSSSNVGEDCVRISSIYLDLHWDYQRAYAATAPGTGLLEYDFTSDYSWRTIYTDTPGNEAYLRSSNYGAGNSVCQFKVSEHFRPCTFSFQYATSCEDPGSSGTYYDYLEVTIDGERVLAAAGDHWGWTTFSTELSQGWHDIVFKYVKDNSVNEYYDQVAIDNIAITYPSYDASARWFDINYLGSSSNKIYFNTPAGCEGWGTKINSNGSNNRGYSNNRYLDSSVSYCTTMINMSEGETLSFDYVVCSEANYDELVFYVNGQVYLGASGWTDRYWHTYTFTAPSDGTYFFKWAYNKDESNSYGWDYAYIRDVTYNGNTNQNLDLNYLLLDDGSDDMTFTTDPTYGHGFQPVRIRSLGIDKDDDGTYGAISRNQYMESTTARLEANAGYLLAGSLIYFDYKISSEDSYDVLTFKVMKGSQVLRSVSFSGEDHRYYETTIPEDGNITFVWEYSKDVSDNVGDDYAMIYNVYLNKAMPSLDEALNSEYTDLQLHFETIESYPFVVGLAGAQYYAESTNHGVNNSVAEMISEADLHAGDEFSFYYSVDSETNYDFFNFFINGERTIHASGEEPMLIYTWTCPADGHYEFMWQYFKDGSNHVGDDRAKVYEVRVDLGSGPSNPHNGDVNGDGSVTVTDAIMALRASMGLITLTPAQRERGDVNNDGNVTVTDAIMILRVAMGLISL